MAKSKRKCKPRRVLATWDEADVVAIGRILRRAHRRGGWTHPRKLVRIAFDLSLSERVMVVPAKTVPE